jgi:hypothetical protein
MQNDVLTINLSTIKLRKIKVPKIENTTQNKSTNTTSTLINSNQRFNYSNNYEDADFKTIKTRKNINSYFVKNPTQKLIEFKKEIKSRNRNILPILSNNYRSVKPKQTLFDNIKTNKIKIRKQKQRELVINPVSLYLITLANENKNKSLSRNKGIKIKDEFLERVKDYRKRLKDQMIKRNKFQYSHSNNSLNKSQSQRKEKEPDKEKENNEMVFNYNQNNNYIFNMNENVDKALNIFYNKLKNPKIIRYDREKSNLYQEKNISNLSGQEIYQNKFHTINIK